MKIIGLDPGYDILGWSVIDDKLTLIDYGTIKTDKTLPFDERLFHLYTQLNTILATFNPDTAAIERLFFQKNTKTAIDIAKTIGMLLLTLKLAGIQAYEYTPTQVKLAITGYGRATKNQIQLMIQKLMHIKESPQPDDAADALAIAICHSCSIRFACKT